MPLHPNGGKLLLPVETEADVRALFVKASELSQTSGFLTKGRYRADIEDHFYYVGAICPLCRKLMFHLCTVASTLREYGDGFRSLFFCEECMQVASQAVGWN